MQLAEKMRALEVHLIYVCVSPLGLAMYQVPTEIATLKQLPV